MENDFIAIAEWEFKNVHWEFFIIVAARFIGMSVDCFYVKIRLRFFFVGENKSCVKNEPEIV